MTTASTRDDSGVLDLFHPLVRQWFREKVGPPTDIQRRAWPEIARGCHVLITAPTGSGKTLTAFLWALDGLLRGQGPAEERRVLYVSPLKALNNDIQRNLEEPLEGLRLAFAEAGETFPIIRTAVRSGDTDPAERREMVRHPPEILITTPESLNILLASAGGRRLLRGITTLILDEIHAVVSSKRGVYLMTAVERLALMSGEFQRIALSATVRPLPEVAAFIGGYRIRRQARDSDYEKRPVTVIASPEKKKYHLEVNFPDTVTGSGGPAGWWPALIDEFRRIIGRNRSTLFFANSRRMVEKITRFINEAENADCAYSHHGSLSRELRAVVEKRFKAGELAAIVATSSLELGIDIGAVDQVVLIQPPFSTTSAIQRIGRAGHGVGQISRGTFCPLHPRALVEAAVQAAAIDAEDIEPAMPVSNPLDVLAQVLLAMTMGERRNIDDLYTEIRAASPFRELSRREFDLVVDMLAGRYADSRIRELRPRLLLDRLDNTARARDEAGRLYFLSGGVIPDRGYYTLRVAGSQARIGELDEEFVWERSIGESFPLGNQIWRIQRITASDVEVVPAAGSNAVMPFWRAEAFNRSFQLAERILEFLEEAESRLETPEFRLDLRRRHHLAETAADELMAYLRRQREATRAPLPHRHHLLVEHCHDPAGSTDNWRTVLHTGWGGTVNRPFAFALAAAWEERFGHPLQIFATNDCLLLNLPRQYRAADILTLVKPSRIRELLHGKLESTGFFGAHFRENAHRALLLPRQNPRRRVPLWFNRARAKKLLAAVSKYEDFPILLETWRECLQREFSLDALAGLLAELETGEIRITEVFSAEPSPFAGDVLWQQTNFLMYEDDTPEARSGASLSDSLLREVLASPHLRPRFSEALIRSFVRKLQRLEPGYAPEPGDELLHWVKERVVLPAAEWEELLAAVERDHGIPAETAAASIELRLAQVAVGTGRPGVAARENLPRIERALHPATPSAGEAALPSLLAEWLRFYGPVPREFIRAAFGLGAAALESALGALTAEGVILVDEFQAAARSAGETEAGEPAGQDEVCDRENVERLLRLQRVRTRPSFAALPVDFLPLFLAAWHRLPAPGAAATDLPSCLDRLFGYPARCGLWETDILPARLSPYQLQWLDTVMRENELVWFGCGRERIAFSFLADLELFLERAAGPDGKHPSADTAPGPLPDRPSGPNAASGAHSNETPARVEQVLKESRGRMGLDELAHATGQTSGELTRVLWELAWAGRITNDEIITLRQGIQGRFRPERLPEPGRRRRGVGFDRWRGSRAFSGRWYRLDPTGAGDPDALDRQEIVKDRIRQLLLRYGVLFREALWNELPRLRWAEIFPVLRLMEFSGEIVSGHFFDGLPGVQFCSREALRLLEAGLPDEPGYWLNAADPASLCGIEIPDLKPILPPRLATTHVVYQGRRPALVCRKNGKELQFGLPPDHPRLPECLEFFKILIGRQFQPLKHIRVERINGRPAPGSEYARTLLDFGFQPDYDGLILMKKY